MLLLVALVSVLLSGRGADTAPVGWEKAQYISKYGLKVRNASVDAKGKFIAAAFEADDRNAGHGIYASVSFDAGISYIPSVKIAETNRVIANNPRVAVSGNGQVFVAWQNHEISDAENRINYAVSRDLGATWSEVKKLNLGHEMEMLPRVFYDDKNRLHLFFHAMKGGSFNLFHCTTEDGLIFSPAVVLVKLASDMRGAFFPAIHLSGSGIYMVWQGRSGDFTDDLYFMKSANYGRSWTSPVRITYSRASDAAPSILLYGNDIYVVYQNNDDKTWSIRMIRGLDFGEDWEKTPIQVTSTNSNCLSPRIAVSRPEQLVVTWYDTRSRIPAVFSSEYDLSKRTFSDGARLSDERLAVRNPELASSGNKALLFWEQADRLVTKYSDVYAAPPAVFSDTHPEGVWSRNSTARIEWKAPDDESGIVGYATMITRPSQSVRVEEINPTIQNLNASSNVAVLAELEDGVNVFHIRAIDGAGNLSRTVHYRIQVSVNPIPMPLVISPTHRQGEKADTNTATFKWTVDGRERLKGFAYSLSKDRPEYPGLFVRDFSKTFENLEPGNYFFSLAAVDKTDRYSPVADYHIVVGDVEALNQDELLARTKDRDREAVDEKRWLAEKGTKTRRVFAPKADIMLPFEAGTVFEGNSFRAEIRAIGINPSRIEGYYFKYGSEPSAEELKVNSGRVVTLEGLKPGKYYLSARVRYHTISKGRKVYQWSMPHDAVVEVGVVPEIRPLNRYAGMLIRKLTGTKAIILGGGLLVFMMSALFFGGAGRMPFYFRLYRYRLKTVIRAAVR